MASHRPIEVKDLPTVEVKLDPLFTQVLQNQRRQQWGLEHPKVKDFLSKTSMISTFVSSWGFVELFRLTGPVLFIIMTMTNNPQHDQSCEMSKRGLEIITIKKIYSLHPTWLFLFGCFKEGGEKWWVLGWNFRNPEHLITAKFITWFLEKVLLSLTYHCNFDGLKTWVQTVPRIFGKTAWCKV